MGTCPTGLTLVNLKRDTNAIRDDHNCLKEKFHILDSQIEVDGNITFDEFLAGWHLIAAGYNHLWIDSWKSSELRDNAARLFSQYDADRDGGLSLEECEQILD